MVEKDHYRKMATATTSSRSATSLSLFDQELMELLNGLRVAGNTENGGDEKMLCEREYPQQNGIVSSDYIIFKVIMRVMLIKVRVEYSVQYFHSKTCLPA